MDLDSLFSTLGLPREAETPPPAMPSVSASMPAAPSPDLAQLYAPPPPAASMRPQSSGPGFGSRFMDMLPQILASVLGGVALKGSGPYGRSEDVASFAQGLMHGFSTAQQQRLA